MLGAYGGDRAYGGDHGGMDPTGIRHSKQVTGPCGNAPVLLVLVAFKTQSGAAPTPFGFCLVICALLLSVCFAWIFVSSWVWSS